MTFSEWYRFSDLPSVAPRGPGIYEIRFGRMRLKVGIAGDLRKRLGQHAASRQSRLKRIGASRSAPGHIKSTGSILAKHLYFDRSLAPRFRLRTEAGRVAFLESKCHVRFRKTTTRKAARKLEVKLEQSGKYRYCGRVNAR